MLGTNTIHANFSVDDLTTAKDFYKNKLGFNVKRENDIELILEGGKDTRINIYKKSDHKPWNSTVLGIEVEDVDEAADDLKKSNVKVEKLKNTDDKGIMRDEKMGEALWFRDPAGNWICVSHSA